MNGPLSSTPDPAGWTARCRVSVIIRAFNQEQSIAAAIESSLAAVSEVGGEVVLADGHSSDRTVEIASRYPIRIVQLLNAEERGSGAESQLGYQHSCGDYLYLLDAGMKMVRGFLPRALGFLAQHPEAAGVSGRLVELRDSPAPGFQFNASQRAPAPVERLAGGGLYRRLAIEESGYLSDRNLHSQEEFDLAVRLRALGWKLWRIPVDVATRDDVEPAPFYPSLMRRWRSGSVCGLGEMVRAAAGHKRLRRVWRGNPELRSHVAVLAWWCLLLSVVFWPLTATARLACFAALAFAPWLLMLWRERSPAAAWHSLASSWVEAAGLLRGLLRPRRRPHGVLACRVLQELPQASASPREHRAWPDTPDRHRFQN